MHTVQGIKIYNFLTSIFLVISKVGKLEILFVLTVKYTET